MPETDQIAQRLRTVTDPDLGSDVVSAGLVTDTTVEDGTVTLSVELTGIPPEAAEDVVEQMRSEVLSMAGVERVRVEGATPEAETDEAMGAVDADRVVAIASAKGGVGKSTVATSLARGLAESGEDVGIFDADIHGPNVPQLLEAEGPVVATDNGHAAPIEAAGLDVMSIGLLDNDAPIAWRGAMAHEALLDLLTDTAWDGLDTLVIDLPPGTGDIVLTTLQEIPVDGVVLVTTPYPTAVEDTDRSATLFRENGVPILGTVVNMAGFTCPSCGDDHELFGHADVDLDVPVLTELPFDEDFRCVTSSVPDVVGDLGAAVRERLEDVGFSIPKNALDVRGLPPNIRRELIADEFEPLEYGDVLTVLTDREPDSLVARLGGTHTDNKQQGCQCENSHEEAAELTAAHTPVDTVETQRVGPETWAVRIEKEFKGAASDEASVDV